MSKLDSNPRVSKLSCCEPEGVSTLISLNHKWEIDSEASEFSIGLSSECATPSYPSHFLRKHSNGKQDVPTTICNTSGFSTCLPKKRASIFACLAIVPIHSSSIALLLGSSKSIPDLSWMYTISVTGPEIWCVIVIFRREGQASKERSLGVAEDKQEIVWLQGSRGGRSLVADKA